MKPNIGTRDRALRILLSVGFFLFLLLAPAQIRWWGLLGFIPLVTAFFGTCPLYSLIGFDTLGSRDSRRSS